MVKRAGEEQILVLAPLGRDAEAICQRLESAGLPCRACADVDELCHRLATGAGAVLLTEETLTAAARKTLLQALASQPVWSDLPVTLLLSAAGRGPQSRGAQRAADVQAILPGRNVTILRRPVPAPTLVSVMKAARLARQRQYEVREHLQERKKRAHELERRVRERTEQVRELAAQLTLVEQAERHRISQILHDDVQQRLFSVQMQLLMLQGELSDDGREVAQEQIGEIEEALANAIEILRSLSIELSPAILHDEGLADALRWLAEQMRQRFNLTVAVEAAGPFPILDDGLRVLLFQIVRELLFNVVKHAHTPEAAVKLAHGDGQIHMEVSDKGQGFDVDATWYDGEHSGTAVAGQGLLTIRRRLSLFDGRMHITSSLDGGTRVIVEAPLRGG